MINLDAFYSNGYGTIDNLRGFYTDNPYDFKLMNNVLSSQTFNGMVPMKYVDDYLYNRNTGLFNIYIGDKIGIPTTLLDENNETIYEYHIVLSYLTSSMALSARI